MLERKGYLIKLNSSITSHEVTKKERYTTFRPDFGGLLGQFSLT